MESVTNRGKQVYTERQRNSEVFYMGPYDQAEGQYYSVLYYIKPLRLIQNYHNPTATGNPNLTLIYPYLFKESK